MEKKKQKINFLIALLFGLFFLLNASVVEAASLYFSPSSGSYNLSTNFTINLLLNSSEQETNAVSATVSFPTDRLEVVSISRSSSIFSLWVQEPSFNNSSGTINLEGIVLNPGFKGSAGRLLSITFKSKKEGQALISLSSGLVLANDGQGTNITSGLGKATITINPAIIEKPKDPEPIVKPPVIIPEKPSLEEAIEEDIMEEEVEEIEEVPDLIIEEKITELTKAIISDWTDSIFENEYLVIRGRTEYSNVKVVLQWIEKNKKQINKKEAYTNSEGEFVFSFKNELKPSSYMFWVIIEDNQGFVSKESNIVEVNIKDVPSSFKNTAKNVGILFIAFLLFSFALHAVNIFHRRKFSQIEAKVESELKDKKAKIKAKAKPRAKIKAKARSREITKKSNKNVIY